ncbi:MAG: class I SAM-dependent rRNA methyltransferase [Alistipes sp.]|nr:class I SAM-dependent rRNA methyltransferase [Candidatus Alistipes equi]
MPFNVYLRRGKEESLKRRHLWIFSGAIHHIDGLETLREGDVVDVYTSSNEFIARGHYQIGSIMVRVLSFRKEPIDEQFYIGRIQNAFLLRKAMGLVDNSRTTCFRLVHGEGDGLPGLIIDIYDRVAVIQCHSVGMYMHRQMILEAIKQVCSSRIDAVYDKSSQTVPFKANLEAKDSYLYGSSKNEYTVLENGNSFYVNWEEGQKTGFFLDQRYAREVVAQYSHGRRVLNTFSYTGGFSVYALKGGARSVTSVDISEKAVALAQRNVELNFGKDVNHEAIAADAVDYLRDIDSNYDLIILDPPAFAKHHKVLGNALQGYRRINQRAFEKIAPGGLLFTFSCSQAVSKELFRTTVFSAAALSGRQIKILKQFTQPEDHPINIFHPEGEYLKGLLLYVE